MFTAEDTALYLIALLFPDDVNSKVRAVQQEIREKFGPSKSLGKPVHITLVPPFHALRSFEQSHRLHEVTAGFSPFKTDLEGFGCFDNPQHPVVFIKVTEQDLLQQLYTAIRKQWIELHYPEIKWMSRFHPHVTVAYRDVKPAVFREMWPYFSDRPFHCSFQQRDFSLLRWENNQWVRIQDFSLA